jgi:hypothetical protein
MLAMLSVVAPILAGHNFYSSFVGTCNINFFTFAIAKSKFSNPSKTEILQLTFKIIKGNGES